MSKKLDFLKSGQIIIGQNKVFCGADDSIITLQAAGGVGPGSGGLTFDPHTITVGTRVNQFGGTSWIAAHKTSARLYLASEHIFTTAVKFGDSTAYLGSNLQLHAREFNGIFSDYEKSRMVVNPYTGDLIGPMSYDQLNGGFSYFNSNSRRACDNQRYWTSSHYSGSRVWIVNADGSLSDSVSSLYPSDSSGFRPFVCLSL